MSSCRPVYIASSSRTPFGSFRGSLKSVTATQLGSAAISNLIAKANVPRDQIDEVFFGNVLQAGLGQAPARQAALGAGLSNCTPCTTVHKVCASGMKAVQIGCDTIRLETNDLVISGGQESLSNVPFVMGRKEPKYGGDMIVDLINHDGLTDAYTKLHMGACAERIIARDSIHRAEQDEYSQMSYNRAIKGWEDGLFKDEVDPIEIELKKGTIKMEKDEEFLNMPKDISKCRPLFVPDPSKGTVSAGNTSKLADGACALLLASDNAVLKYSLKPLAEIIAHADAAMEPTDFTTAVVKTIEKLLKKRNLQASDIAQWEINEAFASVVVVVEHAFNLDRATVNPYGGAISIGHPLGASGARITARLAHTLNPGEYGIAALCNGGGGAGAILLRGL